MTQALITINAVPGSDDNLPINVLTQINNVNTGGELTYLWAILDQPPGTADSLSSTVIQNPTLTPKKEGSYLIRLIVNLGLPDEKTDTVIAAVRQVKTFERIPAAGETTQVDTSDGWAAATNSLFRRIDQQLADIGYIVGVNTSGGVLTHGDVLRVTSGAVIKSGLPGQETLPGFVKAPATIVGNLDELLLVLDTGVDGLANVPALGLAKAKFAGRIGDIPLGSGAVGDTVYISDSATIATTPGSYRRRAGSIMSVGGGGNRDVWFDGVGGVDITPIDVPYVVYGSPGILTAPHRIDGNNATAATGGFAHQFEAGDVGTIAIVAQRFSAAGAAIFRTQDELGAFLTGISALGYVGIGAAPTYQLDIQLPTSTARVASTTNNADASLILWRGPSATTGAGRIIFRDAVGEKWSIYNLGTGENLGINDQANSAVSALFYPQTNGAGASSWNVEFRRTWTGAFGGTDSALSCVYANLTYNHTANNIGNYYNGYRANMILGATANLPGHLISPFFGFASITAGAQVASPGVVAGFRSRISNAGTIDTIVNGLYAEGIINTGTVGTYYGFYYANNAGALGTITNNYGIWLGNQNVTGANNYAIYTNLGLNRLGDALEVVSQLGRTAGISVDASSQTAGYGIQVLGPGASSTYGIWAAAANGATGIWGSSNGPGGTGVLGTISSGTGYAVQGIGGNLGVGVAGQSVNAIGVQGSSTATYGVYGLSSNNIGVYGVGDAAGQSGVVGSSSGAGSNGVYGIVSGVASVGVRGMGSGTNNDGVYGFVNNTGSRGVAGASTGNTSYGGYFTALGTSSIGVIGISSTFAGVRGESTSGVGVSAATASGAAAITASASASGSYGVYAGVGGTTAATVAVYAEASPTGQSVPLVLAPIRSLTAGNNPGGAPPAGGMILANNVTAPNYRLWVYMGAVGGWRYATLA